MPLSDTGNAISAVSKLLKLRLGDRLKTHGVSLANAGDPAVEVGRPEPPKSGDYKARLNLFLYEIHFDEALKNVSLSEGQPAPLWLVLKYLMTAYDGDGFSDSTEAQKLLGEGLRALQESNFMSLENVADDSIKLGLQDNPEPLKITFDEASLDLLSRVMQGSEEKYRTSAAFQVRPVLIAPDEKPSLSLLVGIDYTKSEPVEIDTPDKGVIIPIISSLGPYIKGIEPFKVHPGDEIKIKGEGLEGQEIIASLAGEIDLSPLEKEGDTLTFQINSTINDGKTLSAGSHTMKLVQTLPTGGKRLSNVMILDILPTLSKPDKDLKEENVNGKKIVFGKIILEGFLLGTENDQKVLALYKDGKVAKAYDSGFKSTNNQKKLTLEIPREAGIEKIGNTDKENTYRLILLVNGLQARSSPQIIMKK